MISTWKSIDNRSILLSNRSICAKCTLINVLFIDKSPEYDDNNNPLYDYKVRRVARSLNYTSVAVAKVDVS